MEGNKINNNTSINDGDKEKQQTHVNDANVSSAININNVGNPFQFNLSQYIEKSHEKSDFLGHKCHNSNTDSLLPSKNTDSAKPFTKPKLTKQKAYRNIFDSLPQNQITNDLAAFSINKVELPKKPSVYDKYLKKDKKVVKDDVEKDNGMER